jgi:sulfur-carrier protein
MPPRAIRLSHPRPPERVDDSTNSDQTGATVRFWAAARRAAGHAEEPTTATTIAQLRAQLSERDALARIVGMASFLVDGVRAFDETPISVGAIVDVLPPFAGG